MSGTGPISSRRHPGKYVLIDIRTEKVFLAESPEAAYRKAAVEHEEGPFHLAHVGERAAFRSRRPPNGDARSSSESFGKLWFYQSLTAQSF